MAAREPMMSSFRTLVGLKPEELLNPPLRTVNFSSAPAVVLVSTFLRWAWHTLPSSSALAASSSISLEGDSSHAAGTDLIGAVFKEYSGMSPEERDGGEKIGKERDGDEEVRKWREGVIEFYNHVFVDVMDFLPNVQHGVGHIHPPSHESFEISYPVDGPVGVEGLKGPVTKVWDTHVLLVPAFMGKGVEVRISRMLDGEEKTLECFKQKEKEKGWGWESEVWWVKKETEVMFHVEGEWDRLEEGAATVLAVGILCMREAQD